MNYVLINFLKFPNSMQRNAYKYWERLELISVLYMTEENVFAMLRLHSSETIYNVYLITYLH
jgi:hypothetical protein